MKYYLISGEASGDLHGSSLIRALKKLDDKAQFRVWGGDLMEKEGATLVKHYKTLAFMGFWEVVTHLPTIFKNIRLCKKDILNYNPDVIIYIDYPGFNLRIAKWAKTRGFKNHYYISPQVWAWKENRVQQMKLSLDALYVILPFEQSYYQEKHQFPVHFVGHPLLDQLSQLSKEPAFLKNQNLISDKPIIALLPGSRLQEIRKMLPLFEKVASRFKTYQFVVAGAPGINPDQYTPFIKESTVKIIYNHTHQLLQHSTAALVTSGTATLETALFDVPQLVCYKSSPLSYWIGKKIIKLKYISLVNLVLNKPAVTELIQEACSEKTLVSHLKLLLKEETLATINQDYRLLKKILGGSGASQKTAQFIYDAVN